MPKARTALLSSTGLAVIIGLVPSPGKPKGDWGGAFLWVRTRRTPGAASAAAVSIAVMIPWPMAAVAMTPISGLPTSSMSAE